MLSYSVHGGSKRARAKAGAGSSDRGPPSYLAAAKQNADKLHRKTIRQAYFFMQEPQKRERWAAAASAHRHMGSGMDLAR